MRIIYVLHQFFPRHVTGTETYTLGLAKALQKKGHEVAVLCYEHNHLQGIPRQGIIDDEYDNIPVRRLCYDPRLAPNPVYYEYYNPLMGEWARACFREFKPDVVHFTHCAFLTSAVIEAAAKLKIPAILTLTDFWFICPRMQLLRDNEEVCEGPKNPADCLKCYLPSFLSPYQKYLEWSPSAQKTLFRINFFMKAILSLNRSAHYGALEAALNRTSFLRQMIEQVDTIIAPSRFLEDMYTKNDMGSAKLKYLPFGIDTSKIPKAAKQSSQKLRIAFIGTLTSHKGCHVLIEAFRRIESYRLRLYVYGNTEQFEEYTAKLKKIMGDDQRIRLMGTFPPDDLGKVFSKIDLLAVPSLWYENTPLIVYSALAARTPVVASNMGGLKELIEPGVNGLLFEAGSVEGLKDCLEKIILSPELLPKLTNNIKPVKSIETHAEEILEEYQEIVAKVPKVES
ncbi:MAG: glycosyltransferase family 4 protein [Deltaproteobacteria bacterium]|nr:glycosyltransferase family 4 protein [Deltaproteobacteria bacterium]